ncbi:class I SAM-dependent methyltransferase [Maribacter sp. HTCC2170]|uniref:class I SAM-dependent methyltransferase n=1 Tax=Maribacter sp. (strain HTCC2170 / KCCM 42371) TaxID=313603 RepID=UPI00006BD374|nr:class I SAM-dependent methyltransferase [Maribacter sp. HTCC2170]EAR02795.1 hypothetical protein FB2170_05890 [Maribacter sp. HTCC2170]
MKSYLKTKDYSVTGEVFELVVDEELEMLITQPQPKYLDKYYDSDKYISHTDANDTLVDRIYQVVKKYSIWRKFKIVKKYGTDCRTILDVGAGTGDFLFTAKKCEWEVSGVEPNHDARMRAKEKGVNLCTSLEDLKKNNFSTITLWHVLEHLPNLNHQIKQLVSLLGKEGTMVVAVPNYKSYDAKYYKEYWAAYDVPRHLHHFSKTAIEKLFSNHGMKVVKTKPMVFDSFYVSLLSEKYKTGRQNYVRAIAIGFLSNLKAWVSGEYSSHIYVLKRE